MPGYSNIDANDFQVAVEQFVDRCNQRLAKSHTSLFLQEQTSEFHLKIKNTCLTCQGTGITDLFLICTHCGYEPLCLGMHLPIKDTIFVSVSKETGDIHLGSKLIKFKLGIYGNILNANYNRLDQWINML